MKIKVKKKAPQGAFGYYLYFFIHGLQRHALA